MSTKRNSRSDVLAVVQAHEPVSYEDIVAELEPIRHCLVSAHLKQLQLSGLVFYIHGRYTTVEAPSLPDEKG